ncbi:MAG: DUF1572 domain-containing protein [Cytophagales bacterium]|nr:DUF1572 domain-containing protein [Cytophagales bacterium]
MTISMNNLYQRDLDKLANEISLYENEEDIWKLSGEIKNSAGNLALHLVGNLQHFIGAIMDNTDYVRDRENEFNARNTPREKLLSEIETTKMVIGHVLPILTEEVLSNATLDKIPFDMTNEQFLLHLYGHFGYHLGQINYHRRLVAGFHPTLLTS